jgi:hypothetical protein
MTETIKFPSDSFPGVPAVSLTLPDKWSGAVVPATVLAAVREVEAGQFVSNVIVRTQRVGSADDLGVAAAVVDAGIAELAEVEDISRTTLETDGRQVYCREFAYRHPQAGTLAQAWRVLAVRHDGVTDVFELVGTISPQRMGDLTEIRQLMDSAEISDAVPAGQH